VTLTSKLKDFLVIAGICAGLVVCGVYVYHEKRKQWNIEAVMNGEVRGNVRTRVLHVPTCPQYSSIKTPNIESFISVAEAERSGYLPSGNCLAAVDLRRAYEHDLGDGAVPLEDQDPRQ
jgi:hypothetical protein